MPMSERHRSFSDIVRLYQQPMYWYIRRVVLVHEDTEDILQETFLKAFRSLWQLRSAEAMKSWLWRIATNEMNRFFGKRRPVGSLDELPEESLHRIEGSADGGDWVGKSDAVISSATLRMSPLQRQVFSMRYYDELDYAEISRITGASKNTLMVSYHEARKKIEQEIGHEQD